MLHPFFCLRHYVVNGSNDLKEFGQNNRYKEKKENKNW